MQRRHLLQGLLAGGALGLAGCASLGGTSADKARVLVIGGGYGGATASKYIRLLSDYSIDVMLVEPNRAFISCPVSMQAPRSALSADISATAYLFRSS